MAEVFLARYVGPQGFEKRLVIKRVLPERADDRRFLRLFFEEARTHVSLSHGNLVPVFDFGRVGNAYFIAMEEVRGCDLGTLLSAAAKRGQTLPPQLVAYVGVEVCRGLAYVHRRGFVHRDVSPRNVLLSTEGEVKLSDFGVALAAASDAAPGLRGTLAYMAPEQARSERTDGRADLYALGMVLAEAVTGKRLRSGSDENAALAAARAGAPAIVDGPLAAVIARATATDPAARFADAEAMQVALEAEAAALGRGGAPAARELATRIADLVPLAASSEGARLDDSPPTAATVGEETYFRDRGSASFVEEVLHESTGRARTRRAWIAAASLVAIVGGVVAAGRAVQSAHRRDAAPSPTTPSPSVPAATAPSPSAPATTAPSPSAPATTVTSPSAPSPSAPSPTTPSPAVAPAVPPHRTVAPPTVRRPVAAPPPVAHKPAATGTLLVHCTPWCIPSVDDRVRGSDGRNHRLELPAGAHRVSARRLDDHAERTVEVRAGESVTVDFTFE